MSFFISNKNHIIYERYKMLKLNRNIKRYEWIILNIIKKCIFKDKDKERNLLSQEQISKSWDINDYYLHKNGYYVRLFIINK